ncbi:MAG TPA: preprotein translocase subunit SecE [Solirubrobacteraceae bacterium]|nr:preprotein translocase subunit SecE [Solirubrobacteraceae bacterium]
MARDRQRAKQRRRNRQPGQGGPASGSGRTNPRDAGLEPTEADLDDTTPAPEPTKHAFPDVEEARMAEAGAGDDFEEADTAQPTDPAVLEERAEARRPRRQRGRIITFLGHVVDELRRVQWPDRRQTGQGTAVTLGFVVVAGGFLGLMDAVWKPLVDAII